MESDGFPKTRFELGRQLYDKATIAVGAEMSDDEEINALDSRIIGLQKSIAARYLEFVQAAKISFGKDSLSMLGMGATLPRSRWASFEKAKNSFAKICEHPHLVAYLAGSGFGEVQITSASEEIDICNAVIQRLESLKRSSQNNAFERKVAMESLCQWLSEFCGKWEAACEKNPLFGEIIQFDSQDIDLCIKPKDQELRDAFENYAVS